MKKSFTVSLSFLLAALMMQPTVILADSSDSITEESQEFIEPTTDPPESSLDEDNILKHTEPSQEIVPDDSFCSEPDPDLDSGYLIDPEAKPIESDPIIDQKNESISSLDPSAQETFNEDPLETPKIRPIASQADEPYLGSVQLSFTNDSEECLLIIENFSVIIPSDVSLVSYASDFLKMGVNARNIAFLIEECRSGQEYDLAEFDHKWELKPHETLELEIHIKVSCSSTMYKMQNEIVYDYHYEEDLSLIPPQIDPKPTIHVPDYDQADKPGDSDLEIPDPSFDEAMFVDPLPVVSDEASMIPEIDPGEISESIEPEIQLPELNNGTEESEDEQPVNESLDQEAQQEIEENHCEISEQDNGESP